MSWRHYALIPLAFCLFFTMLTDNLQGSFVSVWAVESWLPSLRMFGVRQGWSFYNSNATTSRRVRFQVELEGGEHWTEAGWTSRELGFTHQVTGNYEDSIATNARGLGAEVLRGKCRAARAATGRRAIRAAVESASVPFFRLDRSLAEVRAEQSAAQFKTTATIACPDDAA